MGALLARILPLALGAALSPTLFALEVLVLSGRRRPLARAWAVAAGSAVMLVSYVVLGLTLLSNLHARHGRSPVDAAIDLGAALLLALLALRTPHRRPTAAEAHHSRTSSRLQSASTLSFFGVGAIGMLVNFSTLVLFIPALHQISRSTVPGLDKYLAGLVLLLITLLPVLIPAGLVTALGPQAGPILARINTFVSGHSRQITAGLEILFAILLAWKGIGEL
ncbi:MAG: GAP family protein [Streptosporangiaceae bacterium]